MEDCIGSGVVQAHLNSVNMLVPWRRILGLVSYYPAKSLALDHAAYMRTPVTPSRVVGGM
jgi:hypothetical protein